MALQRHRLLLVLVPLLLSFPKATVAQQGDQGLPLPGPGQGNNDPITLTVTIADKYGRYVSGLSKDQITIFDGDRPQEILSFEEQEEPFSLVVLFDVSQSMLAEGLIKAREEVLALAEASNKSSEYAIIGFGKQVSVLTGFTQDRDTLIDGLNKLAALKRSANTALYDAFSLAIEKAQAEKNRKRIVLIISDGHDNNSKSRMNDLREQLKRTDVLVYAIVIKEQDLGWANPEKASNLDALCSTTGGMAFYPRALGEIESSFLRFALELKHQYLVTFRPPSPVNAAEWRRLKYMVSPLEVKKNPASKSTEKIPLYIRGREGYYPAKLP